MAQLSTTISATKITIHKIDKKNQKDHSNAIRTMSMLKKIKFTPNKTNTIIVYYVQHKIMEVQNCSYIIIYLNVNHK